MSYLLDKKIQRKKFFGIIFVVIFLVILIYFRSGIFYGLSHASHIAFRPVLVLGNNISNKFVNIKSYFISKNSLYLQNQNLQSKITEDEIKMLNYNSILAENINLKWILGRKGEKTVMTLAAILSKPNQSLYNTLVIDAGINKDIKVGNIVFASGNVPIGRIAETYLNSSKIVLFSNAGEKTQVVISSRPARPPNSSGAGGPARPHDSSASLPSERGWQGAGGDVFSEITGQGGGNFEMIMPQDFTLVKGDQVVLPGIVPYVLGIVETIISDPRDPFVKVLLVSPVNIQELKFVEVEQ